jgi:hypothetical protein
MRSLTSWRATKGGDRFEPTARRRNWADPETDPHYTRDPRARLVLDFQGVEFLPNAQFMGKMDPPHKNLERAGGSLVLCNVSSPDLEIFRVSKLDSYLRIVPTLVRPAEASFEVMTHS